APRAPSLGHLGGAVLPAGATPMLCWPQGKNEELPKEAPMLTRREYLALSAKACAALALAPRIAAAQARGNVITRPIPKTGEELPIIGLGSSATFQRVAEESGPEAVGAVI